MQGTELIDEEGARRATEPLIRLICDIHLMYGTTRVLKDAAGEVTVENILPPEMQERVESITEAALDIRESVFKANGELRCATCEAPRVEGGGSLERSGRRCRYCGADGDRTTLRYERSSYGEALYDCWDTKSCGERLRADRSGSPSAKHQRPRL